MIPQLVRPAVLVGVVASAALGAAVRTIPDWHLARASGPSAIYLNDSANVPLNSPGIIERSQCVGIGLSSNASYRCGDLTVAYALQSVRVLGKVHTPALIYNSQHAHPLPQIVLDVATPSGTTVPDSIRYVVKVNGVLRDSMVYSDSTSLHTSPSARHRIQVGWDAYADPTDVYPVVLLARSFYPGGVTFADSVSTEVIVVNRSNSPLGMGWWISGVEMIKVNPSNNSANRLWVGSDGSARVYRPTGTSNVWAADIFDRPDTLKFNGTTYARRLPGGDSVLFNAQGQHIRTVDPRGFASTLFYASSTAGAPLDSLKLPKLSKPYYFKYKAPGTDTAALDSAFSPAPSGWYKLRGKSYSRVLYQIYDQRGADEFYAIAQSGRNSGRIVLRRERGGRNSLYSYDSHAQLTTAVADIDATSRRDTVKICPFFSMSPSDSACGTRIHRAADAFVSVNGPRPNSQDPDTMSFRIGRFGAPNMVRDALLHTTLIERTTGSCNPFPAFVTKVTTADSIVVTACPDSRGNLQEQRVINGIGAGADQVTTYVWDQKWDKIREITNAIGQTTFIATYNAFGAPDSIADSRANSSYRYFYGVSGNSAKLLEVTKRPITRGTASDFQQVTYDALGNPTGAYEITDSTSIAARYNAATHFAQDAIGRNVLTCVDISNITGTPPQRCTSTVFDIMARDSVFSDCSVNPTQCTAVTTIFDNEGRPNLVAREATGTPAPMYTVFNYDRVGNVLTETAPDGYVSRKTYDRANNLVKNVNRRGDTVTIGYDGANRMKWKVVPTVTVAAATPAFSIGFTFSEPYPWKPTSGGTSYVMPKDSMSFIYDVAGRMTMAINTDTKVLRTYNKIGLLESDSLYIRNNQGNFQKYGITNRCDAINRRVAVKVPYQLATGSSDSMTYVYHPVSNELLAVTTLTGQQWQLNYNLRGEHFQTTYPLGVTETSTFDAVGNIVKNLTSSVVGIGTVRNARYSYDSRGRLKTVDDSSGFQETDRYEYSGLGHLTLSYAGESARVYYGSSYVGTGSFITQEKITNNGYGSVDSVETYSLSAYPTESAVSRAKNKYSAAGRLDTTLAPAGNSRFYTYDHDGNTTYYQQANNVHDALSLHEDRYSYYDAENRLRAADYRIARHCFLTCKGVRAVQVRRVGAAGMDARRPGLRNY